MKKAIILSVILGAFVLNVGWLMEGCAGKIPTLASIVATSTPTLGPHIVANFEDGTDSINPNLIRSSSPNFNWLPGTIASATGAPGANGTSYAGNVFVSPALVTGYTPYELEANVNGSGGVYNLSGTAYGLPGNGIQFYWKTGAGDTMAARWFIVPVPEQIPPSVGNCAGTCYDTYKKPLSATGDTWTLVSYTWSQFSQAGWGSPLVGPLAGTCGVAPCAGSPNISRILYFQWEEDPNNPCQVGVGPQGSCGAGQIPLPTLMGCDFWVDEVQLF